MRVWMVICALLLACGSEKKANTLGEGKGTATNQACGPDYNPLPLLREGAVALSLGSLPAGQYTYTGSEVYVRESGGGGNAHFSEEIREQAVVIRRICSVDLPAQSVLEIPFRGLQGLTVDGSGPTAYRGALFVVQADGKNYRFFRQADATVTQGTPQPLLNLWSGWRLYRVNEANFEFRFQASDVEDGRPLLKRMVVRFRFLPGP